MNRRICQLMCVAFALLGLMAWATPARAAVRAFSSHGSAQFVSPTDFVGTGNATHLGSYREAGHVSFSPTENPAVLAVSGSIVYTAANGHELRATVVGTLDGLTGTVTATITYVGGTGRFASAAGSSKLVGQMLPSGTLEVNVNGCIDF